ncbi:MAG: hypothetical protein J5584_00225 [Clostridia bacterium]|nr:hypothetical protein [Clostridia bacterium]
MVLVLFGLAVAVFWIVYFSKAKKAKDTAGEIRTDHSSPAEHLSVMAKYTCVECGRTVPAEETFVIDGKRFCKECRTPQRPERDTGESVPNPAPKKNSQYQTTDVVALKCKICGREMFFIKGRSTQPCLFQIQSGTYCMGCLKKRLFDNDAAEILFLIDASQGDYSKRVEFRDRKYYYAESRVRRVINPMGVFESDEFGHEITFDQALAYATSEEDKENLKSIEFIRKTKLRLAAANIDKETLAHINVGVGRLGADVGHHGIPYMRYCGDDLWSGATHYDDMRGPQGRFEFLPFDEALKEFVFAVREFAEHPDMYYTVPARPVEEKIDQQYITDRAMTVKKVRISHNEYDEKANLYREVKLYDVVLNDEQSVSEEDYSRNWKSKLETLFVLASGRPSLDSIYTVARHKETKQVYIVKEAFLICSGVKFKWRYISKITEYQLKRLSEQRQAGQ